jgi:NitT/TauT family transport system substrate-binding protein
MTGIRTAPRATLAVLVVAIMLALAACGGGDDSTSSTTSKNSNGAKDLGSAQIVLGGKVITWAPAYVAVCQGFFKDHGLDVQLNVSPQGTTAAIAGLVSGDAISSMTGASAAVSPIREGAPVQLLFNASKGYGVQVVASNALLEKTGVSPDDPLEERVKALKGARIAILNPGDSIDQLLRYVLPKYGMNPDKDITMVALNSYAPMFAAMKRNKIGALAGSPPNGQQAEAQGLGKILFSGNEFPGLDNYPYLVGSANTREIADNPDRVKALVAGIADAMDFLHQNPDGGRECLRKEFADLDDATFDSAYDFAISTVPDSPLITPEIFKQLEDFANASGKPLGVDYDKAVAAQLVKEATGG